MVDTVRYIPLLNQIVIEKVYFGVDEILTLRLHSFMIPENRNL